MSDFRTTTGETLPPPARQRRRRRYVWLGGGVLVLTLIVVAGFVFQIERYVVASGYVTTEEYAEVRSPVSGKVVEVMVDSADFVETGDLLFRLDSSEQKAALEEARAQLRKTEADAARRRIEIIERRRELADAVKVTEIRFANIVRTLERSRDLSAKGLVAGSKLEELELQKDLIQAELDSLRHRDLSLFDREMDVLDREVEARRDAVYSAELRVNNREIRAPISGQVLCYEFVIGELITPAMVVMEIFGGERRVMKIKVAERFSTIIAPGQRYTAVLAPYRGRNEVVFEGHVEHLRNAIQGESAMRYRVAHCSFDATGLKVPPGTTGEARIYYGYSILWMYVFGLH